MAGQGGSFWAALTMFRWTDFQASQKSANDVYLMPPVRDDRLSIASNAQVDFRR